MSRDDDKLIRQLSLLSLLLSRPRPFTAREIHESVEGYAEMSDQTFTRRFYEDRGDLARVGIRIRVLGGSETPHATDAQLYFLAEEDFQLPAVDFTPAEMRALSLALAALDGRFAYARPLRLALTRILRGQEHVTFSQLEPLPVALAPDEDARRAGKQLARLEKAVTQGKTVRFLYPSRGGDLLERTLDPYNLFLIQGRWYVVGRDHARQGIRMFRVGRIQGSVRFLTARARDFVVPEDYRPDDYRARPPWMLGTVQGTAVVRVQDDLAWWVQRFEPHVTRLADEPEGYVRFSMDYCDESALLSWVVGLGSRGQLLEPPALRNKLCTLLRGISDAHQDPAGPAPLADGFQKAVGPTSPEVSHRPEAEPTPIAPERLARAITLLSYLAHEHRPSFVTWKTLEADLGLTRGEIEADLSLINLVNYGGGTYALTVESTSEGVAITREIMADTFSQPARLSPLMARALLLALDLVGDAFVVEGLDSLASVREKVTELVGDSSTEGAVIVDDVLPPDPGITEELNRAIRDHLVVELDYFTPSRQELSARRVEPYLLFRSPDGWYLEAYCLKANKQRTFKLERIRAARATGSTFTPRPEIDLGMPRRGWAFSPDDACSWAVARINPRWRTHLEDTRLQYELRPEGNLQVHVPYADERWLAQKVIRYLGDAVLEQPASARQEVRELVDRLLTHYQDREGGGALYSQGGEL